MKSYTSFLLDLLPDPVFYETKKFWLLAIPALAAVVGLIIYFIRKKNKANNSHK